MIPLRVLIPLDGSRIAGRAAETVKGLSALTGVSVRLIGVVDSLSPFFAHAEMEYERQETQLLSRQLDRAAKDREGPGLEVTSAVRVGPVSQTVLDEARAFEADIIAMARKGRGATPWRLGHVTDHVVREAPCGVLLCSDTVAGIERVLLPLDGSKAAESSLDNTLVAALLTRSVTIARVVELPAMTEDSGYVVDRLMDEAWRYLEGVEAKLDAVVTMDVLVGDAAAEIRDYAEAVAADLIVLTTAGHGASRQPTLGSVADRLLPSGPNVLVVKP